MSNFNKQLLKYIPGGAHTYSRGHDTFPKNAPQILKYGKGVKICDHKKKELIDFGMGLRSVNIGYSETEIDEAAFKGIKQGNNLTRPSFIELEAAKKFIKTIKKVGKTVYFFSMSDYVKPTTAGDLSARVYQEVNCIDLSFRYLKDFYYAQPMGNGEPTTIIDEIDKWNEVKRGSIAESMYKFTCNYK